MELVCKWCGAPIKGEICEWCKSKIDDDRLKIYYQTEELHKDYNENIRKKILRSEPLSKNEDETFKTLLDYNMIKNEEFDGEFILYNILLQNKIISYDTFSSLIKKFVEKTMQLVTKGINEKMVKDLVYVDIKDLKHNFAGSAIEHHFYLFDPKTIQNLYQGDINAFITITHEMYHGVHDIMIKSGEVHEVLIQIIKENIIRKTESKYNDINDSYYFKNYKSLASEIFADQSAINLVEHFLNYCNLKVKDGFFEEKRNRFDKYISNQNRIVTIDGEEKIMTVDEIFEDIISDHPEFLEEYSQLNLEYIKDGDKVRKKTKKELKETLDALEKEDAIIYVQHLLNKNYS